MTRKEEIILTARDIAFNWNVGRGNEFFYRLDKLIEMAQWVDEHPRNPWISVNDRLPDEGEDVMTYDNIRYSIVGGAYYHEIKCWYFDVDMEMEGHTPTHWMPMPKTPESCE